jgi:hypothetical protein
METVLGRGYVSSRLALVLEGLVLGSLVRLRILIMLHSFSFNVC